MTTRVNNRHVGPAPGWNPVRGPAGFTPPKRPARPRKAMFIDRPDWKSLYDMRLMIQNTFDGPELKWLLAIVDAAATNNEVQKGVLRIYDEIEAIMFEIFPAGPPWVKRKNKRVKKKTAPKRKQS